MQQKEIWENRTSEWDFGSAIELFHNPKDFQIKLAEHLKSYCQSNSSVVEVGCELGVTSYLLPSDVDKTLLDFNGNVLKLSESIYSQLNKSANFIKADMFSMPFENGRFDILFNAGVIEHYEKQERATLLKEYSRVMKEDGVMVIAFPNHFSKLYRFGYKMMNLLGRWPFPEEHKLFDLEDSLENTGLEQVGRKVVSHESFYHFFNVPVLPSLLRLLYLVTRFQGYLTVITLKKQPALA